MERRRATDGRVKKRKAEGDLTNERLTKRLESLNLDVNVPPPQLYAAIQKRPEAPHAVPSAPQPIDNEDDMAVDETKHRVYISNLEKEIAEIEAAEEAAKKTIFIPDVDKRLLETRIPHSVFANKDGELAGLNKNQALVLYDFPKSLTVDEDRDSVRKAILEARHRAQAKQRKEAGELLASSVAAPSHTSHVSSAYTDQELDDGAEPMALEEENGDSDVMDLD